VGAEIKFSERVEGGTGAAIPKIADGNRAILGDIRWPQNGASRPMAQVLFECPSHFAKFFL
jgi:hypothetical protein